MEIILHHIGFRCRIGGREFHIPDDCAIRSDETGLLSGCLKDRLDHIARRGLSLRAGDPDGDQFLCRITESRRRKLRQRESSALDPDHSHIRRYFHFFFYHKNFTASP